MPAVQTLRRSRDFHRVRSTGARARSDGVTVWVAPRRGDDATKVGIAARSKSAVERNRIRRRLRAATRSIDMGTGREVVVSADPRALDEGFQDLVTHLARALERAGPR